MNVKEFIEALAGIENRKLPKEVVVDALKEALSKAYKKHIEIPDALVKVDIDEKTGELNVYQQYTVVEEVDDDELEISLADAQKRNPEIQVGELYDVKKSIDDLGRAAAILAKNVLKQKIREAEKQSVYDEYIDKELPDLFALADIVLSRAGANSVFELLALNKPSVLVPLTSASSRGDQLLNAKYFEKKGYAKVVDQSTATPNSLVAAIDEVYQQRAQYAERMCEDTRSDGTEAILEMIKKAAING